MNRIVAALAVVALSSCLGPQGEDGRPGIVGPMGDKGEPGPGAAPGITAVEPRQIPVGIKSTVAISGTATHWSDAASVSFGDGVSVVRVKAASPNALVVDVVVSPNATLGNHDVSVVQGGGSPLQYRNVFQVVPLVSITATGKAARGSLVNIVVTHNDPAFEFDTSWTGSSYAGIQALLSPAGVVLVRDVKPHTVTLLASIDTDAPMGVRDLRLTSSRLRPSEVTFTFPAVFDVADLSENMLTATATGTLTKAFDSVLYKFTPMTTGTEMLASVTTTNGKGSPMLVQVPTNGRFTTYSLTFINSYMFIPYSTTDYRFVVVDPSATPGVEYSVSIVAPTKVTEVEPNESISTPQLMQVPSMISLGTLTAQTDVDVYKVVVGNAELGRALRMRSRAGDYSTDLRIDLLRADGSVVAASPDTAYHEDFRSPPITLPGDYYVKLSWGRYTTAVWSTYSTRYDLLLNWE